jgi:hypothetical protein
MMRRIRVNHIPQVPMQGFKVDCKDIETAIFLSDVLCEYDLFQYENRIKPDYANISVVEYLDSSGDWCGLDDYDIEEFRKGTVTEAEILSW